MTTLGPAFPEFESGAPLRAAQLQMLSDGLRKLYGADFGGGIDAAGIGVGRPAGRNSETLVAILSGPLDTIDSPLNGRFYKWDEASLSDDASDGYTWKVRRGGRSNGTHGPAYVPGHWKIVQGQVVMLSRHYAEDGLSVWVAGAGAFIADGVITHVSTSAGEAQAGSVSYKAKTLDNIFASKSFHTPEYRPFNDEPLIEPAGVGSRCIVYVENPFDFTGGDLTILLAQERLAFGPCDSERAYNYPSGDTTGVGELVVGQTLPVGFGGSATFGLVVGRSGSLIVGRDGPGDNPEGRVILNRDGEIVFNSEGNAVISGEWSGYADVAPDRWDILAASKEADVASLNRSAGVYTAQGGGDPVEL